MELIVIDPRREAAEPHISLLAGCVYAQDQQRAWTAWETYRQPRRWLVGVRTQGQVIALAGWEQQASGVASLQHLVVDPKHRRQGLGRHFLDILQRTCVRGDLVVETDAEAVGFYRCCGFVMNEHGDRFRGIRRCVPTALDPLPTAVHPLVLGGKADGLGRLQAIGLRIPATWVVPAWCPEDPPPTADLRLWWQQAPTLVMSHRARPLDQDLTTALAVLPQDTTWAVRSSATVEDGRIHSFAGRFRSCLKVPATDLGTAIRQVQASLLEDRALVAMAEAGCDVRGQGMAVVLQPMVPGRLSGVLTTADPVAKSRERLRVAVVAGACAGAVDGSAPAVVLTLDRQGQVLERHGAEDVDLSADLLALLVSEALRAEKTWNLPLDLEWTWDGERLWWLQARPLTAWKEGTLVVPADAPVHRDGHWSLGKTQPLTALAQDVFIAIKEGRRAGSSQAVCRLDCVQETVVVDGFVYHHRLDLDRLEERRAAHAQAREASEAAGSDHFHAHALPILLDLIGQIERCADGPRDADNAIRYLELARTYAFESARLHWVGGFCGIAERFRTWLDEQIPGLDHADWQDLVASETWLDRERAALRRMARVVQSEPALHDLCAVCPHDRLVEARLDACVGGDRLRRLLEAFAVVFGVTRTTYCGNDVRVEPLLEERPDLVLGLMRPFLGLDLDAMDRAHTAARQRQADLEHRIRAQLPAGQHDAFHARLHQARQAAAVGGDHHWYEDRRYPAYLRRALRFVGGILADRGQIAVSDDAEHLHLNELAKVLRSGDDYRALVARRRSDLARQVLINPPAWLGEPPPPSASPVPKPVASIPEGAHLTGLSGLHAVVEGIIQVGVPEDLNDPRILVLTSRFDDYAHLLSQVAGVICEWGSPFEHVGILARELGVPVLYQVKHAGTVLATGDRVRLDGVRGRVEILGKEGST